MTNKEFLLELILGEIRPMSEQKLLEVFKSIRTKNNEQATQLVQYYPLLCQKVDKSISSKEDEDLDIDPDSPDDLTHTKPIRSVIDGNKIYDRDWIKIVRKIHILAIEQGLSKENLIELSSIKANVIQGDLKGKKGYHYLPEIDISIQGVDAKNAKKIILHLAENLNIPVEVHYEWTKGNNVGKKDHFIWPPKEIKIN